MYRSGQSSTALATSPSDGDPTPMSALLESAASEMFSLSEIGLALHRLIAREMGTTRLNERSIEDAQLIDFLVQHLQAVGAFLRSLAAETPVEVAVDYAPLRDSMPLADLARRLGGQLAEAQALPPVVSGELDLF
jgi:nitric oxide reductase activation protein